MAKKQSDKAEFVLDPAEDCAILQDEGMACVACRKLIAAYCIDPTDVDWGDIQTALEWALEAFGLPEDYPEKVAEKLDEGEDELEK